MPGRSGEAAVADPATVDYFDAHPHRYSKARLRGIAAMVRPHLPADASICDVGAGGGETLKRLAKALGLRDLTAMDVSSTTLERARRRLRAARIVRMSILDEDALRPFVGTFDVVLVAAVLHHLVGRTRRASAADAQRGLDNACRLAKPGGLVLLLEPAFRPRAASGLLFWTKRLVTTLTSSRVALGGYWNNIGAPVVSFYTPEQLQDMIHRTGNEVLETQIARKSLGYPDLLIHKSDVGFLIRTRS